MEREEILLKCLEFATLTVGKDSKPHVELAKEYADFVLGYGAKQEGAVEDGDILSQIKLRPKSDGGLWVEFDGRSYNKYKNESADECAFVISHWFEHPGNPDKLQFIRKIAAKIRAFEASENEARA